MMAASVPGMKNRIVSSRAPAIPAPQIAPRGAISPHCTAETPRYRGKS